MAKIELEIPEERYELLKRLNDGDVREVLMRLAYRAAKCVEIVEGINGSLSREQENALDWLREAVLKKEEDK